MSSTFRCCAALCTLLLAACAGMAPTQPVQNAPAFELAGRIVVRSQGRGFSSSLRWKQAAGRDEIWLTAPLGQTIAYLQADADGATFTGADQRQYRAGSIENLTNSALGWRFPVAGMRYWVHGQPATGIAVAGVERDEAGRIIRLRQDPWEVAFVYVSTGAAPSRLEMVNGDVTIRFAIDERTAVQP
jgi:outer membrane lipoprotein LolB